MVSIKILVVFHKSIDQRLIFEHFSKEEIQKWFVMYAVNQNQIDKKIIYQDGSEEMVDGAKNGLVIEASLGRYDPELQRQGFMETSCFIHVLANNLYPETEWIGVTQYDMRWTKKSANLLRSLSASEEGFFSRLVKKLLRMDFSSKRKLTVYAQIAGTVMYGDGSFNPMASISTFNWKYLLQSYNQFFKTHWKAKDLIGLPLTLWQTYLMPRSLFMEMSEWLTKLANEVAPWANREPYETHWGVLGGYTERAEGLFMALRVLSGEIKIKPLYLHHDEEVAKNLNVHKEHYAN